MIRFFDGRSVELYASGTAALARAIAECAARTEASVPEAIIPAYGCPNLVAACLHASVYPRLVDLHPRGWGYDPVHLAQSVSANTIAIVAVNFLGVGDCTEALLALSRERRIALIQDSAQFLPRVPRVWPGDYVVLSFGRGKPLNLLFGGALIAPADPVRPLTRFPARLSWRDRILATPASAFAFNCLTHPNAYWALARFPGTHLGRVLYQPLGNSAPLPASAWSRVNDAFERYCLTPSYSSAPWEPVLAQWRQLGIHRLAGSPECADHEPLRLALVAPDRDARDTLVSALDGRGLGASCMYRSPLNQITGIPDVVVRQGPFPNASRLADRLFTLPTYQRVTRRTIDLTHRTLLSWARVAGQKPMDGSHDE